jgi:hypothetical protein
MIMGPGKERDTIMMKREKSGIGSRTIRGNLKEIGAGVGVEVQCRI